MNETGKILFFLAFLFLVVTCTFTLRKENSPGNTPNPQAFNMLTPSEKLKQRLESEQLALYINPKYKVAVPFPAFFDADTLDPDTTRFTYLGEGDKILRASMRVVPNIANWDVKGAVADLCNSNTRCIEMGENYFILVREIFGEYPLKTVEKCYIVDGKCIDYTLYYSTSYDDAVGKLKKMIMDWKPRPDL